MKITKKVKSWNNDTNLDCFGNAKPDDVDHIYPASLGGTETKKNKQRLSIASNRQKKNKTKGKIDSSWRFAVIKQTKGDSVYGIMYIRKKEWPSDQWHEVIPVK